jgi:hypothetical protein
MELAIAVIVGMALGATIYRLGYGLGFKAVQQIQEDMPLTEKRYKPIEQEKTGLPIEQGKTGDLGAEENLVWPTL